MPAPVAIRSQYSDFFGSSMLPVLEEIFRAEMAMHPSRRESLFKTISWDRDIWQAAELHDMAMFDAVAEGADYNFTRAKQGANKTLTVSKYGLGISISEETVADGKMDLIGDMVRKLGRSARESQEIQAMDIFNNGFSSVTTADGVALFSASHTLPSGGTFRNKISTAADLSQTSLDTAISDFETIFVGDSGIIYHLVPKTLLVHSNSRRYAHELIGSELKPDSMENNMNSMKGEGLSVVSSPHLSDTDAWFLLAMPVETGLRIISRTPIETKASGPDVGFTSDSIFYKSRYREVIGATHPYGVYGSAGA